MGKRRKKDRKERDEELEGVNLLELTPRRIAEWEDMDGRVTLIRPLPGTRGMKGWLDRVFHALSARRVRLDEVGSFAWIHLDGERTVGQVVALMRAKFGDRVEPVEERLGHHVWVLRREGFLSYPGWDEGDG